MKVYKLYCKELCYSCTYDKIQEMFDDIKMAIEQDETKLEFEIEPMEMSEKAYESLPESTGW